MAGDLYELVTLDWPDGGRLARAKGRPQLAYLICYFDEVFLVAAVDKRPHLAGSSALFIFDALLYRNRRLLERVDIVDHVAEILSATMLRSRTSLMLQAGKIMDIFDTFEAPSLFASLNADCRL